MTRAERSPKLWQAISVAAAGIVGAVVTVAGCLGWTGGVW